MKNNEKILRAALYIRVSSEEQVRHGYSLSSQRQRLNEYCKEKKYKIVDIYADEGKSARTKLRNRKELLRLVGDVKENKIDRIIFWRLDRWFRNIADYYKVQDILDKYNVDWECTDEEYNTTTSNGRLHLNIKLSIAQNESDQTSDRIKFNFSRMIKNGNVIVGKQGMPLGYTIAGEKKQKRMIKDEETEKIVEDMWNNIKSTGSIRKTLFYINNKYNLNICYDSMRHYFFNTKYYGYYKGVENYCPAYITKEDFDYVQSIIKNNYKCNKRHDYIFSGLLLCPICNRKLAGFTSVCIKKDTSKRFKYPSYRCNYRYSYHQCTYSKRPVETTIETFLLNNIKKEINKFVVESKEIIEKKEIKQAININKLQAKLERLNDLYIEGRISKEKYDKEYENINTQIKEHDVKKEVKNYTKLEKLLQTDITSLYNKLTNINKRNFWASFIEYIIIKENGEYEVHFKS